jgi:hypothetical protein
MPWKIRDVNYVRIRRDGTIEVYPLDDKEPMELLKPKDILIQTEQNSYRPESSYKDLLGTVL